MIRDGDDDELLTSSIMSLFCSLVFCVRCLFVCFSFPCHRLSGSRSSIRRHGLEECYQRQWARTWWAWAHPFRRAFAARCRVAGCMVSSVAAGAHACSAVLIRRVDLVIPGSCALGISAVESARSSSAHGSVSGAITGSDRNASRSAGTMCSNAGMTGRGRRS